MAYATVKATANGSTTFFPIHFPYLSPSHVVVEVNGEVQQGNYTVAPEGVTFSVAPLAGSRVRIYRKTSRDARLVDYASSGVLDESVLDLDSIQAFYLAQEAMDEAEEAQDAIDAVDSKAEVLGQAVSDLNDRLEVVEQDLPNAFHYAADAQAAASAAQATADDALAAAQAAQNSADSAAWSALTARNTADDALADAQSAQGIAQLADAMAYTAVNTANAALPKSGGTMTGPIILAGPATQANHPVTKQQLDEAQLGGGGTPVDLSNYLEKSGGTMTGPLVLAGNATQALHPVPKQQLDSAVSALEGEIAAVESSFTSQLADYLPKSGGAMTGALELPAGAYWQPPILLGSNAAVYQQTTGSISLRSDDSDVSVRRVNFGVGARTALFSPYATGSDYLSISYGFQAPGGNPSPVTNAGIGYNLDDNRIFFRSPGGVVFPNGDEANPGVRFEGSSPWASGMFFSHPGALNFVVNDQVSLTLDGTVHTIHGSFSPAVENPGFTCGRSSNRWQAVYAVTGTIQTSDAREKTPVRPLSEQEIDAAVALADEIGTFQWLESVEKKGAANARHHVGMTVQRAIEVMQSHGLDPFRYGFICHDEWEADENRDAGDRYSFRTDQLNAFIARGLRENQRRLEARISALEAALL